MPSRKSTEISGGSDEALQLRLEHLLEFVHPQRVEYEEVGPGHGKLVVEPLEPGYGVTLGNSLRRVLLSSLEGYGITHVRIDGVLHEYSTIPGVYEDVTEMILNLKQVRLRCREQEPVAFSAIEVEISGKEEFRAGDIEEFTPVFEVMNPDLIICHMERSVRLRMTLYVQRGRKYVPLEELYEHKVDPGIIPVDAIFTPVKRVSFRVENVRVGKRTDYERLTLEVRTDRTIEPSEAILKSIDILMDQLQRLRTFAGDVAALSTPSSAQKKAVEKTEKIASTRTSKAEAKEKGEVHRYQVGSAYILLDPDLKDPEAYVRELLQKSVEKDLPGMPKRAVRALISENIQTIQQLIEKTPKELESLRGIGKKAIVEIQKALLSMGIYWGDVEKSSSASSSQANPGEEKSGKADSGKSR